MPNVQIFAFTVL